MAIGNGYVLRLDSVFNKEIVDVDVSGLLSGRRVLFKADGALIVLVKNVLLDLVTLHFQEQLGPDGVWQIVARSYEFSLGRALCILYSVSASSICT